MADQSAIEWTDATWNPIVGCSIVSPGCTNCYAMKMAARLEKIGISHYAGTIENSKAGPVWTGHLAMAPFKTVTQPLRWGRWRRVFVNSMGDLFHENIGGHSLDFIFAIMALAWQHEFQILTKRPEHMRAYLSDPKTPQRIWLIVRDLAQEWPDQFCSWMGTNRALQEAHVRATLGGRFEPLGRTILEWPLKNIWLGVSTERQQEADERIPLLLQTPAVIRFISAEPLLGPVDLFRYIDSNVVIPPLLDWVIVGGESGPRARPMDIAWAKDLRRQCETFGVAFFMKQMSRRESIPEHLMLRQFPRSAFETRRRIEAANG